MSAKLSNATAAALVEVVEKAYTHSELDVLFLRLDAENLGSDDPERRLNKLDRVRPVVEHLRYRDGEPDVITLLKELIEEKYENRVFDYEGKPWPFIARLVKSLESDGYAIVDGQLVATTPDPAALSPEVSVLERELEARGLDVALRHYKQAVSSYVDGRLEASNSQLRSFLDSLRNRCVRPQRVLSRRKRRQPPTLSAITK